MCGILGTTTTYHDDTSFKNAVQTLVHRGPDYVGIYTDSLISMGHLLLAIRGGKTESQQPVQHQTGPWVLVFNGQLYNTDAIYKDLGERTSDIDTVLLYQLIQKFGWDFISHIHGMFAIALYNKKEKIIRLYRDSSGQKCLYYREDAGGFSFASEIKGLLALPNAKRTIDAYALSITQSIGYLPGHRTLVGGISKLLPSEVITYDLARKTLTKKLFDGRGVGYYDSKSPEEVMHSVIHEHLQSKKELSINLSGGMDSSLIFHEAVTSGHSVTAFSTRFDIQGGNYNYDAELAERLAHEYGQTFVGINVTKRSYLENFVTAYSAIEEPNFNISVPIYYETARNEGVHGKGLRVVLSGDGGDELFGGYPHYRETLRLSNLKSHYSPVGVNLYKWIRDKRYLDYREPADRFYALRGFKKTWQNKSTRYRDAVEYLKNVTSESMQLYASKSDDVYRQMLFDRFVWLPSENFIRSDKLYMKESMEMRCPLAYQPLRTYMDTHIPSSKYITPNQNKLFLRDLYTNKLPDYITKRKDKTGWRAPVEIWYDASYKELFIEILRSAKNTTSSIDWPAIIHMVEQNETWPGKTVHLYLSIALIIKELQLTE